MLLSRTNKKGEVDYTKLLADKGVVVTDTDVDSYRGKGKESFRITVAKDFNLTDVDTTPLQIHRPKAIAVPDAPPNLGKYRDTVELVI